MNQDDLDTLTEVRQEIRRINQAAMRTIFNPAATEALEELIQKGTTRNQIIKAVGNPHLNLYASDGYFYFVFG